MTWLCRARRCHCASLGQRPRAAASCNIWISKISAGSSNWRPSKTSARERVGVFVGAAGIAQVDQHLGVPCVRRAVLHTPPEQRRKGIAGVHLRTSRPYMVSFAGHSNAGGRLCCCSGVQYIHTSSPVVSTSIGQLSTNEDLGVSPVGLQGAARRPGDVARRSEGVPVDRQATIRLIALCTCDRFTTCGRMKSESELVVPPCTAVLG